LKIWYPNLPMSPIVNGFKTHLLEALKFWYIFSMGAYDFLNNYIFYLF
jgi:hypothetical protein